MATTNATSLRADPLNLVYSVCELVHNIVFESRRVARTYVSVFDWLESR